MTARALIVDDEAPARSRMRRSAARSLFTSGDCGRANSYYFNEQGEAAIARLSPTPMAGVRARTFDLDDYRWTAPPPA